MNLFKLAWKNLTNKPLSMLLSLVLFALGVGMVSILFLLNKQVQDKFKKNLAGIDMVVGAKGSPLQMILCNMYHVDNPTGNIKIADVPKAFKSDKARQNFFETIVPMSVGDSYSSRRIIGTTHEYPTLYDAKIAQGRLWTKTMEATVGAEAANFAKLKIGDTFFSSHGFESDGINEHEHGEFKVVGIFEPTGSVVDQLILTNTESVWEVHNHEGHEHEEEASGNEDHNHDGHNHSEHDGHNHEDHDHSAHEGHDHSSHEGHDHDNHNHDDHDHAGHDHHNHDGHDHSAHVPQTTSTIENLLTQEEEEITALLVKFKNNKSPVALNMGRGINENSNLQSASPAIEMNRLYDNMDLGEKFLRNLAAIIIFVSGLSVFISLFNSLRDRKYELSLMRVMGASRWSLFTLIILEGLILAVLGYIIGIALSHIGMSIFAGYMSDEYHYSFSGSTFLPEEFKLLFGALLIGFIASIIPAFQAFNTDISETLTDS